MGWFSKKQQPDVEQKQQAANEPFVANDQTVARVAELMKMFNEAEGNIDRQLAVGGHLCSLAGSGSMALFLSANIDTNELFDRPWKMLAAVTQRASQNADHFLVAKIFSFTFLWGRGIAPHLDRADLFEVPMADCPAAIEAEIATIALDSLKRLSGDWIIFSNTTGTVMAKDIILGVADVLVHAPEKGIQVEGDALADARLIFGPNSETKG